MLAHKNAQRFRYTPLDSLSRKLLSFHSAISLALALARVFSHKRLGTMRILGPAMVLINETPCVGNTFSPRNLAKPSIAVRTRNGFPIAESRDGRSGLSNFTIYNFCFCFAFSLYQISPTPLYLFPTVPFDIRASYQPGVFDRVVLANAVVDFSLHDFSLFRYALLNARINKPVESVSIFQMYFSRAGL